MGQQVVSAAVERPQPRPSRESAFFWEGAERGVLLGQRCASCKKLRHPPRPMCASCQSVDTEVVELSGRGTVHSWMKPVHPPLPMFEPGYLVALIDLEEGIRLLSNLCEVTQEKVTNGMPVEVFFAPTAGGKAVPVFRPQGGE